MNCEHLLGRKKTWFDARNIVANVNRTAARIAWRILRFTMEGIRMGESRNFQMAADTLGAHKSPVESRNLAEGEVPQ